MYIYIYVYNNIYIYPDDGCRGQDRSPLALAAWERREPREILRRHEAQTKPGPRNRLSRRRRAAHALELRETPLRDDHVPVRREDAGARDRVQAGEDVQQWVGLVVWYLYQYLYEVRFRIGGILMKKSDSSKTSEARSSPTNILALKVYRGDRLFDVLGDLVNIRQAGPIAVAQVRWISWTCHFPKR